MNSRSSFTLIELLVVLAIVAILSVVVIITLNPSELLRQSRDSNRLSDLGTLNRALGLFSGDVNGGSLGNPNTVYVSIPDASSSCSHLGLPTLPSGWNYACVNATSTRNTDGTGWIPVNFQSISFGSPISSLPLDPTNTTTTGQYFTYVTGGSYRLTTHFESQRYIPQEAMSGGADPAQYTLGDNLSLAPFTGGLVGWWKFDEGNGSTTADSSGYGNTGTFINGPTWTVGRVGPYAYNSTGAGTSYVSFSGPVAVNATTTNAKTSVSFWAKWNGVGAWGPVISWSPTTWYAVIFQNGFGIHTGNSDVYGVPDTFLSTWVHIVTIFNNGDITAGQIYVNGVQQSLSKQRASDPANRNVTTAPTIGNFAGQSYSLGGIVDDVRIYNRALSAAEVMALYNASK
jgi:prepilin-type N-terminal cleavage/methylation domain-containing protein